MSKTQVICLKQFIPSDGMTLFAFLTTAKEISAQLSRLHQAGYFHQRINPSHIQVKVVDNQPSGITLLEPADPFLNEPLLNHLNAPATIEHLPYISPEQTGRMNQVVDQRSDLYSLGVMFFEMASGHRPFTETDPMLLVHSHIAKAPPKLIELKPDFPQVVSDIIERLLAKSSDNRYKSCQGLYKDLELCCAKLKDQHITPFELGTFDHYETFHIPNKLYGRESELSSIAKRFMLVTKGKKQVILLSGQGGMGKTALFEAFAKDIESAQPILVSGKFDQLGRGIAYSALGKAFQELVKDFLKKSSAELARWRETINNAWGKDGRLITDLVPGLTHIVGEQPDIPVRQPEEAKLNFIRVFGQFVSVFVQAEHPVVLFMDDLQWADAGSLELLTYLSELASLKHIMLIFAYRDDEIHPHHQTESFFKRLLSTPVEVSSITLNALSKEHIADMVEDCLDCSKALLGELSEFIRQKTAGNAFFVSRFLLSLYEDKLLSYDSAKRQWVWDLDQIRAQNITNNVVELMSEKIQQFEPQTQKVMQLAAMLGNTFETSMLGIIAKNDESSVLKAIQPAISGGLFISLPDGFRFTHDRVQEAAYLSIPDASRAKMHLDIARLLLDKLGETAQQEMLFDIARHYMHALELVTDEDEKKRVAHYLLKAAEKAISSAAWEAALPYTSEAINSLLTKDSWHTDFDLTWQLHKYKAYCEYTTAKLQESENTLKISLQHAQSETQHVDMHVLYSRILFQMNRYQEGIENSRIGLKKLGVEVPANVNKLRVLVEFAKFRFNLKKRSATDLMTLGQITDEHLLNICRILYDSVESSYMIEPETMAYFSLKMANICITHGNSIYAPFAYAMVSLVMTGVSKEFSKADEFVRMAIELNKTYPDKGVRGRVYMLASVFIWHWSNPIKEHAKMVNIASQCSLETGSIHWSYYPIVFSRPQSVLFNQNNLADVIAHNEQIYQFLQPHQDREAVLQQQHLLHFCYWLNGNIPATNHVTHFDHVAYRDEMHTKGNALLRAYYHCYEAFRRFLQNDYQSSLHQANEALSFVNDTFGNLINVPIYMLFILSYFKHREDERRIAEKGRYLLARKSLRKIAQQNPTEFNAIYLLCEADRCRINDNANAIRFYEQAISEAETCGYGFIKALAYELAASYYKNKQALSAAQVYMEHAIEAYKEWGAHTKAKQLFEENVNELLLTEAKPVLVDSNPVKSAQSFDLEAIIRASQVLSREIEIDQVLDKLMGIAITIAGAEVGHLVLAIDNELIVRATAAGDTEQISTKEILAVDQFKDIADSVVHYVFHTGEKILLGNARKQGAFVSDDYINDKDVKSLICLPMRRQGSIIGVLYLENRLVENAFTENHVSILDAILTQASISLENAELFEQRKQNLDELKRLSLAAEQSPNSVLISDQEGRIEYVNASCLKRSGLREAEVLGQNMFESQLPSLDEASRSSLLKHIAAGETWFTELFSHRKSGKAYWEQISISPVLNTDRTIQNLLLIKEDITSRKEQEAQILYQAQFDALTDLPNRLLATDRLNQAIASAQRDKKKCALLFIDLDDFKKINDTQGHESGDRLLKTAAQRLKNCIRENDTVARQGGDEFIIILKDIEQALDAEPVTEKIVEAFNKPFELHNIQTVVTTSIGIAIYPDDGNDAITLLRNADAAMYQAKASGRNTIHFFDQSINKKAVRKLELERHLRHALAQGELNVHYQPVVDVARNKIIGAEALLRWTNQMLGSVSPDEFIPVAEQTGLIVDIGLWVFRQACMAGHRFQEILGEPFRIAVNVSPRQFRSAAFIDSISGILNDSRFPAQNLDLEVTEGLFLDTSPSTLNQFRALKLLGVHISLDDFGTGYSSLNYLRIYPFDTLKIDRSFIKDLNEKKEDQALVQATIAMAKALGLKVLAEGVEDKHHLNFLHANDCHYAQGYYFSHAVEESEFASLLIDHPKGNFVNDQ